MRHHRTDDDEGAGQLAGGTGEWPLPSDGGEDLAPGELWEAGGPGSAEAAARGCLCPMLPNDPRAGLGRLIAPDCPIHRTRPG